MRAACALLLPFAMLANWPATAQSPAAQGAVPASEEATAIESEIVVSGVRLRDPEELPVKTVPPARMDRVTRGLAGEAARFSRCAGLPRPALLRRILDGRPETGETQKALHQHLVRNIGCLSDVPTSPVPESPYFGACNPDTVDASGPPADSPRTNQLRDVGAYREICRTDFDRGFIYEEVLRTYAPDFRLTRSNTFDHATRDYFRAREEARNGARSDAAAQFFFAAACMVQVRPEYALALLHEEPGSPAEARLRAMLISDGSACVGNAPEVRVDSRQFRAFVAEAVYSWAVAVRRADSLLPMEARG